MRWLIFLFIVPVVAASPISIKEYPNASSHAFIFTVDDFYASEPYEQQIAGDIISFLEEEQVPATLFAIPERMSPMDIPASFEVAQHGFSHVNPKTGSVFEYEGLTDQEIKERITQGKAMLESMDYIIVGHRAPGWSLRKDQVGLLKEDYLYDSSMRTSSVDPFEIPAYWPDLTSFICTKSGCSRFIAAVKQEFFSWSLRVWPKGRPVVIVSHYWGWEKALKDEAGVAYLREFFDEVNKEKYWKTTLHAYQEWTAKKQAVTYTFIQDRGKLIISWSECLPCLTYEVEPGLKVQSSCKSSCKENSCVIEPVSSEGPSLSVP